MKNLFNLPLRADNHLFTRIYDANGHAVFDHAANYDPNVTADCVRMRMRFMASLINTASGQQHEYIEQFRVYANQLDAFQPYGGLPMHRAINLIQTLYGTIDFLESRVSELELKIQPHAGGKE